MRYIFNLSVHIHARNTYQGESEVQLGDWILDNEQHMKLNFVLKQIARPKHLYK